MTDDLAVLVHELRTPIAALDAIVETLETRGATLSREQRRRFVELAIAAANDVERLLTQAPAAASPVDVASLVRDVAETAATGGGDVRTQVEDGLPAVAGDAGRLRQALRNLVENGLAHGPPVLVSARSNAGGVAIAVSDEGDGIAAADQERIFERGTRLTDARPGSGLGLAVVREVAEEHGGSVAVSSSPGQGATFTLVLPPASASG